MRRPRRRTVVLVLLGLAVVWAGAVAWLLLDARAALTDGRAALERARADATPAVLTDPATRRRLAAAEADFARAERRLANPLLAPARVLPVVGRQVRAAHRLADRAAGTARVAEAAVADLRALTARSTAAGPGRLALLDDLDALETGTADRLAALDPGEGDGLIGPLGDAVDAFAGEQRDAVRGLRRASAVTRALRSMLVGPRPYLLLGANNAEMRAGSGMFLSAATLSFADGRLDLGDVRPTAELVLPEGSVPATGDLAANWAWIDGGRDLRNLGLTADFPQSAALAAANWAQVPGGAEVAGVLVVDVDALRGLLEVVGPVEVDGIRYTADTVRGELLVDQYRRGGDDPAARDERRDRLGDVADAVFQRIEAGDGDLDRLATALVDAVRRRHLLVWSSDLETQEAWEEVGAAGALEPDSVAVSLLNRGAEKLDPYLDTTATLTTDAGPGGTTDIDLTYRIASRAPTTGPAYQIGPNVDGLAAGGHRAIVAVDLPAGATDVTLEGAKLTLRGGDGPAQVVAGQVDVGPGATVEVSVHARLPASSTSLVIEPSARIPPTRWTIDGHEYRLDVRRRVPLRPR